MEPGAKATFPEPSRMDSFRLPSVPRRQPVLVGDHHRLLSAFVVCLPLNPCPGRSWSSLELVGAGVYGPPLLMARQHLGGGRSFVVLS